MPAPFPLGCFRPLLIVAVSFVLVGVVLGLASLSHQYHTLPADAAIHGVPAWYPLPQTAQVLEYSNGWCRFNWSDRRFVCFADREGVRVLVELQEPAQDRNFDDPPAVLRSDGTLEH